MEQNIPGMNPDADLPESLPDDIDELGSAELADDLIREQATGPVPLGPAIPGEEEDTVLIVETALEPEEIAALAALEAQGEISAFLAPEGASARLPEDTILGGIELEISNPWYRSRGFYVGAGLLSGTALAFGAVLLLRGRRTRTRTRRVMLPRGMFPSRIRPAASHPQGILNQWSRQLSSQASRLSGQARELTGQASKLTGQAQGSLTRLARSAQGTALTLKPLQRPVSASNLVQRAQTQLSGLPKQASGQLSSLGSATRATTTQAISKTQANLAQARANVGAGAANAGRSIRRGWKLSRTFTLGMAAGALWAAFFTPESGEDTRQHFSQTFRGRNRTNR